MRFITRYGVDFPWFGFLFDGDGDAGGGGGAGGAGGSPDPGGDGNAGGDGTTPPEPHYRQFVPEEERAAAYWEKTPDDAALVKNYINLQKLAGKKGFVPPEPDAPPEKWKEFYAQIPKPAADAPLEKWQEFMVSIGAPENGEAYSNLAIPESFPKEFVRPELVEGFKAWAADAKLMPWQADLLFSKYMEANQAELGKMPEMKEIAPGVWRNETLFVENQQKVVEQFKAELGANFGPMMHRAEAAVKELGGDDLWKLFGDTGLGDHPTVIKAFLNIAKMRTEDGNLDHGAPVGDAKTRLDSFTKDPKKMEALLKADHPDHKAVVAERDKLMKEAHPDTDENIIVVDK